MFARDELADLDLDDSRADSNKKKWIQLFIFLGVWMTFMLVSLYVYLWWSTLDLSRPAASSSTSQNRHSHWHGHLSFPFRWVRRLLPRSNRTQQDDAIGDDAIELPQIQAGSPERRVDASTQGVNVSHGD